MPELLLNHPVAGQGTRAAAGFGLLWPAGSIPARAFAEQGECIRAVQALAAELIQSPPGTPAEYIVRAAPLPEAALEPRRNLFSTLFQSVYFLLGIAAPRRRLYGQLTHLFRIWVTSADNLLDDEAKPVLPLILPRGGGQTMTQVLAVMTADRILERLLSEAADAGTITPAQARRLSAGSLQVLLPSAALEASEEGGIRERPPPEEVLKTIHRLKTGLLFNLPFFGPEICEAEQLDAVKVATLKAALMEFGLGCQILDDIRDLARDWLEGRHNYLLSRLTVTGGPFWESLPGRGLRPEDRLYRDAPPEIVHPAVRQALALQSGALTVLVREGLDLSPAQVSALPRLMLRLLDVEDLDDAG